MQHFERNQEADGTVPVPGADLVDSAGRHAHVAAIHAAGPELAAVVRLDDGAEVVLPISELVQQDDGSYRLPFALDAATQAAHADGPLVIPVIQEEVHVKKRVIDTGRGVRVNKTVSEREEQIAVPVARDELQVERVPVGRIVERNSVPAPRQEGDAWIVPVFEEVLVVEKRLRLVEEVRIVRKKHEEMANQNVVLRSEQVVIEHFDEHAGASASSLHPGTPESS